MWMEIINNGATLFTSDIQIEARSSCSPRRCSHTGELSCSPPVCDLFFRMYQYEQVVSLDSSVGRAVDCSGISKSIGHWFDSGSRDGRIRLIVLQRWSSWLWRGFNTAEVGGSIPLHCIGYFLLFLLLSSTMPFRAPFTYRRVDCCLIHSYFSSRPCLWIIDTGILSSLCWTGCVIDDDSIRWSFDAFRAYYFFSILGFSRLSI